MNYGFIIVLSGSPKGGQVITMPDPVTGQLIPHMIQTTIDPKTGKPIEVVIPLQGGVCRGNVYEQRDWWIRIRLEITNESYFSFLVMNAKNPNWA